MFLPPPNELSILPNAVVIPHAEQVNSGSTIKNNENQPKIPYIYTTQPQDNVAYVIPTDHFAANAFLRL